MSRQVDVASGCLCERKEFSRRILPLRSAKRLLERAPSIYNRLGYAVLLGIVHRMLPWLLATKALDSTVTFLNTTDCRTGRRAAPATFGNILPQTCFGRADCLRIRNSNVTSPSPCKGPYTLACWASCSPEAKAPGSFRLPGNAPSRRFPSAASTASSISCSAISSTPESTRSMC